MIIFMIQGSSKKQLAHSKAVTGEGLMEGLLTKEWEGAQGNNQGLGKHAKVSGSRKQLQPIGLMEQK